MATYLELVASCVGGGVWLLIQREAEGDGLVTYGYLVNADLSWPPSLSNYCFTLGCQTHSSFVGTVFHATQWRIFIF